MEHKKLHKSATDKKICGVCGGLAEYLNVDPTIIRLIWALTVVFAGTGVLAYLIAALVMPEDVTPIV
ncbi:MAG: PspC domain-containing protein [Acutalibacteraceae bacterium]